MSVLFSVPNCTSSPSLSPLFFDQTSPRCLCHSLKTPHGPGSQTRARQKSTLKAVGRLSLTRTGYSSPSWRHRSVLALHCQWLPICGAHPSHPHSVHEYQSDLIGLLYLFLIIDCPRTRCSVNVETSNCIIFVRHHWWCHRGSCYGIHMYIELKWRWVYICLL